jgi:hypothetical protein
LATGTADLGTNNGDIVSAIEFWRCYSEGRITWMERVRGRGYRGDLVRVPDATIDGRPDEEIPFSVQHDDLVRYDYVQNPKFSVGIYSSLAEALSAVIDARLMQTETIPNVAQLRLVAELVGLPLAQEEIPYSSLRSRVLARLSDCYIELDGAIELLRKLKPNAGDYQAFKKDGDLDRLHVERGVLVKSFGILVTKPKTSDALKIIIENRSCDYIGTVELAIWALGRQNEKESIAYLIGLLEQQLFEPSVPVIERALQFVCSGDKLITRSPVTPIAAYWTEVQSDLPKTSAEWAAHDASSVLWEKRLRCAHQWARSGEHGELLEILGQDEVGPVRAAAEAAPIAVTADVHLKVINGTKLDLLSLKELFGAAVAALYPTEDLRGIVPTFGEQVSPGVALTLASEQVVAFLNWLEKQRTLRRALQIAITNQRGEDITIALSDERYDDVDAKKRLAADLEKAVSRALKSEADDK